MISPYAIWSVARYEAKLLWRSWAFRIFSILGLVFLVFMNIGLGTTLGRSPHFFHSLSGSLPLMNIKLLNVYQGIIAAFLATEFIKRDRKHDTTQVIYTRSFSNLDYILGKITGIFFTFAGLNAAVLLSGFTIHRFFSPTVFAWEPYVFYTLFVSIPTLVFMVGASFMLVTLLRNQAVVFVVMLGYSLLTLLLLNTELFYIFDIFGWFQPLIWSDLIGAGNLPQLLMLRGGYFLLGLSLMAITVILTPRLRQSKAATTASAFVAVVCLAASVTLGVNYLNEQYETRAYREDLRELSSTVNNQASTVITRCDLDVGFERGRLVIKADIETVNRSGSTLDSLLLTLNPALRVTSVQQYGSDAEFNRDQHLLWINPLSPIRHDDTAKIAITYEGTIDERYCYLDIDDERYESSYGFFLYFVPKRYGIVEPNYVHLTHESGWYPISGLPAGAAFPAAASPDYVDFSLSVTTDYDLTAISQGLSAIGDADNGRLFTFEPESPLPCLSLTIGEYEQRQVEVDSTTYTLYNLPGHDYYAPYFDEIADTLPALIREVKTEYEVLLGMEYPHPRLSIVEVPIQTYSYRRAWTLAQESVQPQIVFLPEMGTVNQGTDFLLAKHFAKRRQERANFAETPATIQSGYFMNFAKVDILGISTGRNRFGRDNTLEGQYHILPNMISYSSNVTSNKWPILNYAFESYFFNRIAPPTDTRSRRWTGLTDQERANLALKDISLENMIGGSSLESEIANAAIDIKGRYLLSSLEAAVGEEKFAAAMNEFVMEHQFDEITDDALVSFVDELAGIDFASTVEKWYSSTELPGYLIEDIESYKVIEGERTKSQVKFTVANPTNIDGMLDLSFRYQTQDAGPRWHRMQRQEQSDYSMSLRVPAGVKKQVGIVLDQPPAEMIMDSYVSQNLPAIIRKSFRDLKLERTKEVFEGEIVESIDDTDELTDTVKIVDNEDPGFGIKTRFEENWLRRTLLDLFGTETDQDPYGEFNVWHPPSSWSATTHEKFYGKFVHSALYKKKGLGMSAVYWTAEMDEPGEYDVYFYHEGSNATGWRHGRRGWRRDDNAGVKNFVIHYEDGQDSVPVNLDVAEEGWNYLGTYRLTAGQNKVELTDQNEIEIVTADAVKWEKQ